MKERRIEPLYDGLRRFFSEIPAARGQVRVEFTGRFSGGQDGGLPAPPDDLRDTIVFHPYTYPDKVEGWLREADVFLLVEAKLKNGIFMPSKLADYLAGGRPILALSPATGTVADYLQDGGGLLAGPEDVAGIAAALAALYARWRNGTLAELAPRPEQIRRVSPAGIVPIYEQAFAYALANP